MASNLSPFILNRAGLPTFDGASLPDKLVNGRNAALVALKKYVPNLNYDPDGAAAIMRQVQVWEERNRADLEKAAQSTSTLLPPTLQLTFGSDKAQQFIVAMFTVAAQGLGPWTSGAVSKEAQAGTKIQDSWARDDADARLQVFGGIVKMDQDGSLASLFSPPSSAVSGLMGFGIAPVLVWAVVVAVIGMAMVITCYLYAAKRLVANNKIMSDLCASASKSGDANTVQECVKASADLQQGSPFSFLDQIGNLASKIGAAILVGGLAYAILWIASSSRTQARSSRQSLMARKPVGEDF